MKRLGIIAVCMMMLFAGCAKDKTENPVDPMAVAKQAFEATAWTDEVAQLEKDMLSAAYGVDGSEFLDFAVWMGSGATAEEVAIFVGKDKAGGDAAQALVENRVKEQMDAFKDYMPAEVPKLEKPLIVRKGDTVFLVVADDTAKASEEIEKAYK